MPNVLGCKSWRQRKSQRLFSVECNRRAHIGHQCRKTIVFKRIFTMLDTPVPIWTLKLSNIGPGYYLDGRPFREFQVLLAPYPPPPSPCGQSTVFSDSLCLNQWLRPAETKKNPQKTIVLICHKCPLNSGVEKMNYI